MFPKPRRLSVVPLAVLLLGGGVATTALPANAPSGALLPLVEPADRTAPLPRKVVVAARPAARVAAPVTAPVPASPVSGYQSHCNEEDPPASAVAGSGGDASLLQTNDTDPRAQLQSLVQLALERSKPIGAARLLTEAAKADLEETKASRLPSVVVSGTGGYVGSAAFGTPDVRGTQGTTTIGINAPLFDFGHITKLTEWRTQLFEAAKYGQSAAEEQLALQTVSLALDRNRYILQAQVYKQYTRRMSCLVDALQIITQADKGRASELVQAQKSWQQADLSYEQTISTLRQTEIRLRRFVGDQLPVSAGMSSVLARIPDVNEMQADLLQAPDVAQVAAQAKAQHSYAESVQAGLRPSLSLVVSASKSVGTASSTSWLGGVQVNVPVFQPGSDATVRAAVKRGEAADLQRDDTIEGKRYRLLDTYEQATGALDRARRIVDILRNSDRVRASTLQQWQQLGRRSLFDVMGAEGDYYSMRIAHVNALFDTEQLVALIWSMGRGVTAPLR